jgi:2'-5' RNA ligase
VSAATGVFVVQFNNTGKPAARLFWNGYGAWSNNLNQAARYAEKANAEATKARLVETDARFSEHLTILEVSK